MKELQIKVDPYITIKDLGQMFSLRDNISWTKRKIWK